MGPPFIRHEKAIWKGNNPRSWGQQLTMVINHLLNGMILQVDPQLCSFRPHYRDYFISHVFFFWILIPDTQCMIHLPTQLRYGR